MLRGKVKVFVFLFFSWNCLVSQWAWASVALQREWARSTLTKAHHTYPYFNKMPPLLTEDLVIQGNDVDGIQAFYRRSGDLAWSFPLKNGLGGGGALGEGKLYFAGQGTFYCLNAKNGQMIWTYPLGHRSWAQPLVRGGRVFLLSGNDSVYAFNARTGQSLWVRTHGVKSLMTLRGQTTPVYGEGLLYVGYSDGSFVALNEGDGRPVWSRRIGLGERFNDVDSTAQWTPRCILVSSYANALYCLDKKTGRILWSQEPGAFNRVLYLDDRIYRPTASGKIDVLDAPSGKRVQSFSVKGGLATEIQPFGKYLVYGESKGALVVLDRVTLDIKARFDPGTGLFASPTVDEEKKEIYFLSNQANLFKFILRDGVSRKGGGMVFPWNSH